MRRLSGPELIPLICRHLSHNEISAVEYFFLTYSDELLVLVISTLRHNPVASLQTTFKDKRVTESFRLLEGMKEMGFEPSVVTYHCLINGFVEIGDVKRVEKVLELMDTRGVEMNGVRYTLLIKSYCRFGEVDKAEKVLVAMKGEESLVVVDVYTYGILIDGYCRCSRVDDALRIMDEMLRSGLNMSLLFCNLIISGHCRLGRVREAEEFVIDMYR